MRTKVLMLGLLVAPLIVSGCASTETPTPLTVRFVSPSYPERLAEDPVNSDTPLMVDSTAVPSTPVARTVGVTTPPLELFHVALWGGFYSGQDVTYTDAPVTPGDYTFGFWDDNSSSTIQGWMHVNAGPTELVDTLRSWQAEIPHIKQSLAYEFEIEGKVGKSDQRVFKSFARQLRSLDRLDRQIDRAIQHELQTQAQLERRQLEFFEQTSILVFPVGPDFFHLTTAPAYSEEDLDVIRNGNPMSKLMLVADYESAQSKLRSVNQLCKDLQGCREVLSEEVDRLERLKRFFTVTDHIYHHNHKFVTNELRIQRCLSAIDRINEQIADVRNRRMALAFTTELVAPDTGFRPLMDEQRALTQEHTLLETKKRQLDLLYNATDEQSPRRVVLERHRMRVDDTIEAVDTQLSMLNETRMALQTMKESSRVIHRQGDSRLLTANFVDEDIPFRVRYAVEHEALMTLRLQKCETGHQPFGSDTMRVQTTSYSRTYEP